MKKIKSLLLLVEPKSESNKEKVLPSGIIIPAGVKEKSNTPIEGVVKQTGGPTSEVPMEVGVGEVVWYMKDAVIVDIEGKHLIHQDGIIQIESSFDGKNTNAYLFDEAGHSCRSNIQERWDCKQIPFKISKYPLTPDDCYEK